MGAPSLIRGPWLVCKCCGVKEWITWRTKFVGCARCGLPRYIQDDNGNPLVIAKPQNPFDFTPHEAALK